MKYSRNYIAQKLVERLELEKVELSEQFKKSKDKIGFFTLDDVLPNELALKIFQKFPSIEASKKKKNLREYKYVAYQMDAYDALLEEVIYAFQDERVVHCIAKICGKKSIVPDEHLYAGGLSMMHKGNFLNPHLDNSHDKDRQKRRVLNLLYYVTPDWKESYGGNLEIWPNGLENKATTLVSRFNRLVIMETHQYSWHSVSKVQHEGTRCCVSNYYFSHEYGASDTFHVTTFRGRPSQKVRNVILMVDAFVRTNIRRLFKKGIRQNPHKYNKKSKS